jgi:pimeloyl-ACP methyl ester carboxylesterase
METVPRIDDHLALPDGRRLAYAEFGDPEGRPVLFLHAMPGYRRNIWATDAELRSAGVRLIAPDRPGVGRSTPQPRRLLLDWPDDVRQLADALALECFAVVGFSNGGPHAAACAFKLGPRVSGTALVAPLPPRDAPGALQQLGLPGWYYLLARRAPWALRAVYAGLVALARRDPRRAERLLVGAMSEADRRLFGRPEWAGRFGAATLLARQPRRRGRRTPDAAAVGLRTQGGREPGALWLGEHDKLVSARVGWSGQARFRSARRP